MTESRLRHKAVFWWGIGLMVAGLLLTIFMPQIGYAASTKFNSATGVDQGSLLLLEVIVRLIAQVTPLLGGSLIAAPVVMAYVGRLLEGRAPVLEPSLENE